LNHLVETRQASGPNIRKMKERNAGCN